MRSDDDMPGEGFYELYRVLFYPGLHERSADRMRDVRREQRAFAKWGPLTGSLSLRRRRWRMGWPNDHGWRCN